MFAMSANNCSAIKLLKDSCIKQRIIRVIKGYIKSLPKIWFISQNSIIHKNNPFICSRRGLIKKDVHCTVSKLICDYALSWLKLQSMLRPPHLCLQMDLWMVCIKLLINYIVDMYLVFRSCWSSDVNDRPTACTIHSRQQMFYFERVSFGGFVGWSS